MKREDIAVIAQILSAMKESVDELEKAKKRKDEERIAVAKKEILKFQEKLSEML